jgi:hypothetical protein
VVHLVILFEKKIELFKNLVDDWIMWLSDSIVVICKENRENLES